MPIVFCVWDVVDVLKPAIQIFYTVWCMSRESVWVWEAWVRLLNRTLTLFFILLGENRLLLLMLRSFLISKDSKRRSTWLNWMRTTNISTDDRGRELLIYTTLSKCKEANVSSNHLSGVGSSLVVYLWETWCLILNNDLVTLIIRHLKFINLHLAHRLLRNTS